MQQFAHIIAPCLNVDLTFRFVFQQILQPSTSLTSFTGIQLVVAVLVEPLQERSLDLGFIQRFGLQSCRTEQQTRPRNNNRRTQPRKPTESTHDRLLRQVNETANRVSLIWAKVKMRLPLRAIATRFDPASPSHSMGLRLFGSWQSRDSTIPGRRLPSSLSLPWPISQ
ncbi:MAG: hypothetical protein DWI21_16560 [Planctomycetota bacterium]|nr:MAG: hypothetical protein DWI21_16560 [Planctomycetota bacterium]